MLVGGDGADKFVFTSVADSNALARDVILDFTQGSDKIDLSAIDAVQGGGDNAFNFVGSAALQNAGDLRAYASGGNTVVTADVNGDHAPDLLIVLRGNVTLTAADFILYGGSRWRVKRAASASTS